MIKKEKYHERLRMLMDDLVNRIYDETEKFPKHEIFGVTSQIRRASLSVVLNYIEGYARQRINVMKNFYEISYGSLQETKYLVYFATRRNYIIQNKCTDLVKLIEEISRMLWGVISKL